MSYTAVKSYTATKSDEISVNMGSVVEVLQKSENGWWLIRCATSSKLATARQTNTNSGSAGHVESHRVWLAHDLMA